MAPRCKRILFCIIQHEKTVISDPGQVRVLVPCCRQRCRHPVPRRLLPAPCRPHRPSTGAWADGRHSPSPNSGGLWGQAVVSLKAPPPPALPRGCDMGKLCQGQGGRGRLLAHALCNSKATDVYFCVPPPSVPSPSGTSYGTSHRLSKRSLL